MASGSKVLIHNFEEILEKLGPLSPSMSDYLKENSGNQYVLCCKSILHSDLSNRGKRCGPQAGLEKNILYYQTVDEMVKLVAAGVKYETAKQSNMGIPSEILEEVGIKREKGSLVHLYLVNDTLTYFSEQYTVQILNKLGKKCPWEGQSGYSKSYGEFTEVDVTYGDHGIGLSSDEFFTHLRLSIFLGDNIYFLVEKGWSGTKLFLLFEKNPSFFKLLKLDGDGSDITSDVIPANEDEDCSYIGRHELPYKYGFTEARTLVGCFKNLKHLKWILQNNLYNIRSGNRKGALSDIESKIKCGDIIVIYYLDDPKRYEEFEITAISHAQKQDMIALNYPSDHPGDNYILFGIKPKEEKHSLSIIGLLEKVNQIDKQFVKGKPIIIK